VRSTTGQGPAASAAKISPEQRSKIVGIFREHKVAGASRRAQIPRDLQYYPVPPDVA
jgi:hypothetical protein